MKAHIFTEKVSDNTLEAVHGMGYRVTRLHIPEANNLVITVYDGKVYAFTGYTLANRKAEATGAAEVPDNFVAEVLQHIETQKTFEGKVKNFWAMTIPKTMPQ